MIFFTVIFSKFCKKSRSSHQRCSIKKAILKNFCSIHRKTPVSESLFDKVVGLYTCNFIKKTLTQMFFCEYCNIFKNTYFEKQLQMTAFVNSRAAVFQESLALPFKRNALSCGICNLDKLV